MTEIRSNDFYNCIHGYIYSIPEHNVYLHKCNVQEECNCVNCLNFIPKIIVKPIEKIKKNVFVVVKKWNSLFMKIGISVTDVFISFAEKYIIRQMTE